jgi:hypothetical protein
MKLYFEAGLLYLCAFLSDFSCPALILFLRTGLDLRDSEFEHKLV